MLVKQTQKLSFLTDYNAFAINESAGHTIAWNSGVIPRWRNRY